MRLLLVKFFAVSLSIGCLFVVTAESGRAEGLPAKFTNGFCQERFDAAKDIAYGFDVSEWQGAIDWSEINEKTGTLYVFMRASLGITPDPNFTKNWEGAGKECLLRGYYHYFVEKDDPVEQATKFYEFLEKSSATNPEIPIVADIERGSATKEICNDKVRAGQFVKKVYNFITSFEDQSGQRMMIYTSNGFWDCLSGTGLIARNRYLWIAEYLGGNSSKTHRDSPAVPKEWKHWNFWQMNDTGRVAGIEGKVDADRFSGSGADLLKFVQQRR